MTDAGFMEQFGDDPHLLVVIGGTETLMHPEGCPVSLSFGWDDGHPTHTVLYECPAAREAWGEGGSGIPSVPDGAYLVSVEVEPGGVVGWVLSDVADLFGAP